MFDIDKLFMSRMSYNSNGTTEFEEDSDEYLGNRLLEDYISILKDSDWSTTSLNGPIDNDTQLLTDIVEELYGKIDEECKPYDCYRLGFQSLHRSEFSTGKTGIGPFALNNNNHVLTMLYGVMFKITNTPNILQNLGLLDLSKYEDRDGNSILSWISGLINAHVDVAKDPYIGKLNVNEYTYNLTNLLIRTGLGKTTFYFLTQPIMFRLSEAYSNVTGKYMIDQNIPTEQRIKLAEHAVIINTINACMGTNFQCNNNIDEYNKSILVYKNRLLSIVPSQLKEGFFEGGDEDFLIKNLFSGENNEVLKTIAKKHSKEISSSEMHNIQLSIDGNTQTIELSEADILILCAIANEQFKPYASSLSSLVKYTKIDTKKQGKTLAEQQDYLNNYYNLFDQKSGSGLMFEKEGLERLRYKSYIETKTVNATNLLIDILGGQLLEGTRTFKSEINKIINLIEIDPTNRNYTAVQKAIISKIKSKYFFNKDGYCDKNGIDPKSLLCGDNTIYDRLINIKADLQSDVKYRDPSDGLVDSQGNIINYALKSLVTSMVDESSSNISDYSTGSKLSTYNGAKFIQILNYLDQESIDEDAFRDSWLLLMENDKYPELLKFAKGLVVYAFMTSGDNGGKFDLFKYVPNEWKLGFDKIGYNESYSKYMLDLLEDFLNSDKYPNSSILTEEDIEDIILNNWDDNRFIPKDKASNYTSWATNSTTGFPIVMAGIVKEKNIYRLSNQSFYNSPKYIKIPRNNKVYNKGQRSYTIFKLFGEGKMLLLNDKTLRYPIYVQIDARGDVFEDGHRINEYSRNDRGESENKTISESIFILNHFLEKNNIPKQDNLQDLIQRTAELIAKKENLNLIDGMYKIEGSGLDSTFASILKGYTRNLIDKNSLLFKDNNDINNGLLNIAKISDKTAAYGVEVSNNSEDFWNKIKSGWKQNNPKGIIAYRKKGDSKETFSVLTVNEGWIGNPFSTTEKGINAVQKFYNWIITGNNFGNERATEELRQAIINKLLNTPKDSPILYYTELNRPSHATVLGYLIRNKGKYENNKLKQYDSSNPINVDKPLNDSERFNNLEEDKTIISSNNTIYDNSKEFLTQLNEKFQSDSNNLNNDYDNVFYTNVAAEDYVNELVASGIDRADIEIKHIPATDAESEYYVVESEYITPRTTEDHMSYMNYGKSADEFDDFVKDNSYWDSDEFGDGEEMNKCKEGTE